MILTGTYHMPRWRGWQPYGGAGAVYAIILHEEDRAVSDLIVLNDWGFVLQGGIERAISNNFDLFVDVKEAWLAVGAHGNLLGQVPVTASQTRSFDHWYRHESSISLNTLPNCRGWRRDSFAKLTRFAGFARLAGFAKRPVKPSPLSRSISIVCGWNLVCCHQP